MSSEPTGPTREDHPSTAFGFFALCLALVEYKARQAGSEAHAAAAKARQAGSRQEKSGDFQVKTAVFGQGSRA